MRITRLLAIAAVPLFLTACLRCESPAADAGAVLIMSYNLQTLFDPVDQGGEYADFRVSSGAWSERLYRARLASLASSILAAPGGSSAGPDVLVVQEAENERVLADLAEAAGGYPYVASSPDEDSTLRCGILSRFPISYARAHRVRPPDGGTSSVPRYVLEAELDLGGRRLIVMAAHWKSKLGGAAETEAERRAAAAFVRELTEARLASDPSMAIILAGDLNENPDEYERVDRAYPTALMPAGSGDGDWLLVEGRREALTPGAAPLVMYCPWDEAGGYSYKYRGDEERIDQLLMSPGLVSPGTCPLSFESFSAVPPDFAVDGSGSPVGWDSRTGSGYSDHLPILARLLYSP